MARPSKLTEKQWADVIRQVNDGKSVNSVAKAFGISEGAIRLRIVTKEKPLKSLANQMAKVEAEYDALPISTKLKVRSLADTLKGISFHISSAAEYGAMTSHRLSMIANAQVDKIDDANPLGNIEAIKEIAVITELSNKSASTALNLLAANKGNASISLMPDDIPQLTTDRYAQIAKAALDEY